MSDEIKKNKCEICGETAENTQIGRDNTLHYACGKLKHIKQVWIKYVKV